MQGLVIKVPHHSPPPRGVCCFGTIVYISAMMRKYILNGKTPVPCDDILEWAKWYDKANRTVKKTIISDDVYISTVFLGLDHAFLPGPPMLFETMIFGGEHNEYTERYSTWDEAEQGHERATHLVFEV